jgi:hypothetical protein
MSFSLLSVTVLTLLPSVASQVAAGYMPGATLANTMVTMGGNTGTTSEVMVYATDGTRSRQTSPCTWTSPSGDFFDFSDLARQSSEEDYMVNIPHSDFTMMVNLCANALKVPKRCASKSNSKASVGFQWNSKDSKSCWELGELGTEQFSYIDNASPEKGVEIMYSGGTPCSKGVRMVHYHMICAGDEQTKKEPSFAWESPTCHYHVVWPTPLACKNYHSFSLVSFLEDWFLFIIFAAVAGSLVYSVMRQRSDGIPVKETMGELSVKAMEKSLDFVSSIKAGIGSGIGGASTSLGSVGRSGVGSNDDFGSGGMTPMPLGGDAL